MNKNPSVVHNGVHILKTYPTIQGARIALKRRWLAKYPNAQASTFDYFRKHVDPSRLGTTASDQPKNEEKHNAER